MFAHLSNCFSSIFFFVFSFIHTPSQSIIEPGVTDCSNSSTLASVICTESLGQLKAVYLNGLYSPLTHSFLEQVTAWSHSTLDQALLRFPLSLRKMFREKRGKKEVREEPRSEVKWEVRGSGKLSVYHVNQTRYAIAQGRLSFPFHCPAPQPPVLGSHFWLPCHDKMRSDVSTVLFCYTYTVFFLHLTLLKKNYLPSKIWRKELKQINKT